MRILVVEDDVKIQALISKGLRQEGHTVDTASTGMEGQRLWDGQAYDAVVLDIMLPEISGLDLLRRARSAKDTTPVLILSARGAVDDRITGLDTGADDYMIKPFAFSELSARIHAITRRKQASTPTANTTLALSGVRLDLLRRVAFRDDRKIELQPREFALLELMMKNPDHPLSKSYILERIWGYDLDPQTNVVDVLVCRLRAKIDSGYDQKVIRTLRGIGYVFNTKF
ncbi:MAG: response regulator transcription factor [Kiritimatiellae bacterium]|nr:response regulator transcription factor [Kiritimatiellia bacterium]